MKVCAPKWTLLSVLASCVCIFSAVPSGAAESHGNISVEDFYSNDSSSPVKYNFLTTRLKLDVSKLNKAGSLAFHFDGRERVNFGSKRSSANSRNGRINAANFDYQGDKYYLAVGRLWPKEMPVEAVDGVNVVYQRSQNAGIGAFGGFRPDPYTEDFTKDHTTAGAYAFYHKESFSGNIAYARNGFKGGTDRQYIYGQASYFPFKELMLFGTVTTDINPLNRKVTLTNAITEANYRPDGKKSVAVGYSVFRAIKYYKSMPLPVDDSRQQSYYIAGNYRIRDKYNFYARYERQARFFPTIQKEFRNLNIYRAGVSIDKVFEQVNMDLNASTTGGDGSKHNSYSVELNRLIREVFQAVLTASYMQNSYSTINSDNIWTYGVSGYYYFRKNWNFSFNFDREQGRSYTSNHLLTRVAFKF